MTERRMVFVAPVSIDFAVDSRGAARDRYHRIAAAIEGWAEGRPLGQWRLANSKIRPSVDPSRPSGLDIDVDSRRGITVLPRFFIERSLMGDALAAALTSAALETRFHDAASTIAFRPTRLDIRIYEFGRAVLTVDGHVTGASQADAVKRFRDGVERLSSRLGDFTPLVDETVEAVRGVVPDAMTTRPHQTSDARAIAIDTANTRMQWVHRVFVFRNGDPLIDQDAAADSIVFRRRSGTLRNVSIDSNARIYVGDGNSLAVQGADTPAEAADNLVSMIRSQNAYYSRLEAFDAELLQFIVWLGYEIDRRDMSGMEKIRQLEEKSAEIVDLLEYAVIFKSAFDDYAYHLDPQSRVIWEEVTECWGTHERFNAVDNKLKTLDQVYGRVTNSLRSLYDSQLNGFVILFTLVGLFSVIIDVIGFVQDEGLIVPNVVRVGVISLVGLLLVIIAAWWLRRRTPL